MAGSDWELVKMKINECVSLVHDEANFLYRCKYILENIDAPWSHPTLQLIFNGGNDASTTISDEQLVKGKPQFFLKKCVIFFF